MSDNTVTPPPSTPDPITPGQHLTADPEIDRDPAEQLLRRLYRDAAIPPALRDGPIVHTYRDADTDADHARRLREIQNLAAILAGGAEEVVLDDHDDTRHAILTTALNQARHHAAAAGVPPADIALAYEVGRSGLPWTEHPAHRLLGRIEQLTDALQHAQDQNAALDALLEAAHRRERDADATIDRLRRRIALRDNTLRGIIGAGRVDVDPATGAAISRALDSLRPDASGAAGHWIPDAAPSSAEAPEAGPEVEL
ncbi:hypothetical protein [Nocardia wallacei]|uniref:hypothetical protein n=1 Tax=Nocardia wallacei TaxID=480035 RepID=UPI002457B92E|nr:hypothetical protein [Nocardia wallacei]